MNQTARYPNSPPGGIDETGEESSERPGYPAARRPPGPGRPALLRAHRAKVRRLTELLLEKETADGAAVCQIADQPAHAEGGEALAPRRVAADGPAGAAAPRPLDGSGERSGQ